MQVPRSRDDLDLQRLLGNLVEWGGENMEVLDSNTMWDKVKHNFSEAGAPPHRVLLLTSPVLLQQLAASEKWSQVGGVLCCKVLCACGKCCEVTEVLCVIFNHQDGTHRTSPDQFDQIFITMNKVSVQK